ncbi:signal peptidase I [Rhodococcus sp. IEGM 1370]|uniref:signal peptidase I n=1 Tax=Rhodococcus sp. IEGM 1370 TaxID=3082222 RepID=UPI002952D7A8|nr:signal peptidase I [Rhodococcus sp. IEGM 1370]MDV8078662.1 signal peptidase I [Rhodococcus sp. IEGM 1370]
MSDTHAASATRVRSRPRLLREIALTVGAVAGLICVLFALAAVFFGITPLIFRSGSMAPAIDTGALALSKTTLVADIEVGDIVKVTNASGAGITHRVVEIGAVGTDSAQLFLQGDANAEPDAESYVVSEADRVFFSVGKLGYAVSWLSGPVAVFIGGIAVGALLMTAFGFRRPSVESDAESTAKPDDDRLQESRSGRHSAEGRGTSTLGVVLALATISAVGISASNTPTTLAAGQDTATALSGTITTALPIPAPLSLTCTNDERGLIGTIRFVNLTFPSRGAQYTYQLTLKKAGENDREFAVAGTAATGVVITQAVENGALLELLPLPLAPVLDGVYTASIRTKSGTRFSQPSPTVNITMNNGLLLGLAASARCGGTAAAARSAPQALVPETTTPAPTVTSSLVPESTLAPAPTTMDPSLIEESPAPPPVEVPPTTTTEPPTTTTVPPTTTTTTVPPPTTTTPPAPAVLSAPVASPSGASTAQVVDIDGVPTLQIVDATGAVQYSAPATSSEAYGYGVNWSAGDQLWLLGPDQLVRLDGSGGSWSRTVIDPTATDLVPADILELLN